MYTVPIYLKGKRANSSAGFEGETCKQPRNQNKKHPGEWRRLHLEKVESGARCATQRKQTAFVALFAVMSELGINCLIAQTFSRIKFKARKKKQKQRLDIFCFARRNSGHHRILIRNSANINRIKHAK